MSWGLEQQKLLLRKYDYPFLYQYATMAIRKNAKLKALRYFGLPSCLSRQARLKKQIRSLARLRIYM
jgi:hypothetical protein